MSLIQTLLNGRTLMQIDRSYWAAKLTSGRWISEAHKKTDLVRGTERLTDWTGDLVETGLVRDIAELWLLCPPGRVSLSGNTARLPIIEPGTAFQFKVGTFDSNFAESGRTTQGHIIGRVTDKASGACECFIWDAREEALYTPETTRLVWDATLHCFLSVYPCCTSVNNFNAWSDHVAHIGQLGHDVLGLQLA